MAWSELERLVDEAEGDAVLRRGLRRCRSRRELILVACRLGYRINLDIMGYAHTADLRNLLI
jgi:hypothetical protein